jgi:hypothetical protein
MKGGLSYDTKKFEGKIFVHRVSHLDQESSGTEFSKRTRGSRIFHAEDCENVW